MYAGLDFGTSNSAVGIWRDGAPQLLPLEDGHTTIPSTLYTAQAPTLGAALHRDDESFFGEAAIQHHLLDPHHGYYVKSPKSFLGARLEDAQIQLFTQVLTRMLANLRTAGSREAGADIDDVVIGKPVNFHGRRGEEGNRQALSILERAARAAGFRNIEFQFEPIAAALDYERTLQSDRIVLVLDAGGGTTDCSVVKVGPTWREHEDRSDTILGYSGTRVGGTDFDIRIVMHSLMPHFGMNGKLDSGLPIPKSIYWNAATINDVNAQRDFYSAAGERALAQLVRHAVERDKVMRLQRLHDDRHSYRLNRSAEAAKIALSDRPEIEIPLGYIEEGFSISLTRDALRAAIDAELTTFLELMEEARQQADVTPDVIYVTGGTARSPLVQEHIRSRYPDADIVIGDLFGSVALGLTTWARRVFGGRS